MSPNGQELLPGETSILSKNANALIRVDELGLSRFAFDHAMGAVGLRGAEAIGGKLHLTTYRLVFESHAVNRTKGEFSIFLPTVREVRNTSSGLKRQMEVATGTQRFTFIVWGVPALIAAIEQARAGLDQTEVVRLVGLAGAHPALLGEGLQTAGRIEAVNQFLTRITHPIAGSAPLEPDEPVLSGLSQAGLSTALNLAELQKLASGDA